MDSVYSQLPLIENPDRGCGNLKEGGFYAAGDEFHPQGRLKAWTWCLGDGMLGGHNLAMEPHSDRSMTLFNLPMSLGENRLYTEATHPGQIELYTKQFQTANLSGLPQMALLDHVGSSFYTPTQFAKEVMHHGSSRRLAPSVAEELAGLTPIPIVYTHKDIPLSDGLSSEGLATFAMINDPSLYWWDPSFLQEGWGIYAKNKIRGDQHWMVHVLEMAHHVSGGKNKPWNRMVEWEGELICAEQIFGISWITHIRFVAPKDITASDVNDLIESGIKPVRIGE